MNSILNIFLTFTLLFQQEVVIQLIDRDSIEYDNKYLLKALKKDKVDGFESLDEIDLTENILNGKFFKINHEESNKYQYVYVGRVNSCRSGGCSLDSKESTGNSEYFDYFILFDKDVSVKLVKVFNYQATHGQEITSRGWLSQFKGYKKSKKLVVNKNIDSISGATISVNSITNDIKTKTLILSEFVTE